MSGLEFSPVMVLVLFLSFFGISFFMGMLIHSSFMYEDGRNLKGGNKKAWTRLLHKFFLDGVFSPLAESCVAVIDAKRL